MKSNKIYQASTLQALALGYTRPVVTVQELLEHGDTGLGTFENVDGEMIVLDGVCYQAKQDGSIVRSDDTAGVPFAVAGFVKDGRTIKMEAKKNIEAIKLALTMCIDEDFGLNTGAALAEQEEKDLAYLIFSGHGGTFENQEYHQMEKDLGGDDSKASKRRLLKRRFFISGEALEKNYPFVAKHRALYPLLMVYRPIKGVITHPKGILKEYRKIKYFKKKDES